MSTILFKHLKPKPIQQPIPIPEPKKSIWHFFKSQLGLFGEPQKTQTKPANRIPFASQKEKEEHNVGDLKSENNKQYIFLETTIGKPRWHSHEELVTMAKEGKKIPEIAKKKMPGLEKGEPKAEEKAKPESKWKVDDKAIHRNGETVTIKKVSHSEQTHDLKGHKLSKPIPSTTYQVQFEDGEVQGADDDSLKPIEKKEDVKPKEPEPKQSELVQPESNVKKKSTPIEKYVQGKIREGNNEPAISRQQEIRKNEATEKQKEQQEELTKLLQRKAQLQREIGSELEASKKVNKGGQEYKVDTKDVARQEMKQLDKKIGNLKQALGKLGENVFEQAQNEDMFSQSPAKPKTSSSGITVKFKISPEFAQTIAEAKAGKAKEKNKQYAIEQLEKEIKYFESWRGKEDIDEEKVETAIAERKKELSALQDKDQLSENINKKIVEQSEKEKPTLKKLMEVQSNVLKLAEIPEKDMAMYALSSMADGAKLRSYSTEVIKGEMTAEQAAEKVKGDYQKMIEGEKPMNAGEMLTTEKKVEPEASTEQKISEYVEKAKAIGKQKSDLYAEMEKKPDSNRFAEIQKELQRLEKEEGTVYKEFAKNAKVEEIKKAETKLNETDKDTLPLLPSEKDSKEGDTKTINNITYQLKRGESGELRWHRVTEEEKKDRGTREEGWEGIAFSEMNEEQKKNAMEQYAKDTGDEARFAGTSDWEINSKGDVRGSTWQPPKKEKQSDSITMPKQEAIDEHKNLVKVLESGTEEERKAEAAKQAKELEGYEEGMDEGTPEDAPERFLKELVEERTKINEAFDKLIEAAKEELGIGVEKPKEGKRISSEVQMQKSLYNPSFFETYFRRTR